MRPFDNVPRTPMALVLRSATILRLGQEVVDAMTQAKDLVAAMDAGLAGWLEAYNSFELLLPVCVHGDSAKRRIEELGEALDVAQEMAAAGGCLAALIEACGAKLPDKLQKH